MFKRGDKVKTIVHGKVKRIDLRGEVVANLKSWNDISSDFIKVKFNVNGNTHVGVFFAEAFELDA